MLYVTLDKITGEPQGMIDIELSDVSAWSSNFDLIECAESFRGKFGYELRIDTGNQVRLATAEEIIEATKETNFNYIQYLHRLAEEFTGAERLALSKLVPSFVTELQFCNFVEIKAIRDALLIAEQITQAQADTLTSLFAEQNIDLEDYSTTGI